MYCFKTLDLLSADHPLLWRSYHRTAKCWLPPIEGQYMMTMSSLFSISLTLLCRCRQALNHAQSFTANHCTMHELTLGCGWHVWLYSESTSYCDSHGCCIVVVVINELFRQYQQPTVWHSCHRRQCYPRQLSATPRLEPSSLDESPSTRVSIMKTLSPNATWTILHDTSTLTNIKVAMQSWWSVIGGSLLASSSSLN